MATKELFFFCAFVVGHVYHFADSGLDPIEIVKRTNKTVWAKYYHGGIYAMRIHHDDCGNEYIYDSKVPVSYRNEYTCKACWEEPQVYKFTHNLPDDTVIKVQCNRVEATFTNEDGTETIKYNGSPRDFFFVAEDYFETGHDACKYEDLSLPAQDAIFNALYYIAGMDKEYGKLDKVGGQ